MSEQALNGGAEPAQANGPQFSVEKIYVKDVSFESPKTPHVFNEQVRYAFHGALQEATSCEVLNVARDGAGFLQSMASYLKDDAFKTARPALIVWEIPERFLTLPLDDEAGWLRDVGLQ